MYTSGADQYGNAGDVMLVQIKDAADGPYVNTTYNRYYTPLDTPNSYHSVSAIQSGVAK